MLQWTGTFCFMLMYGVISFVPGHAIVTVILAILGCSCFLTWSVIVKNEPQMLVNCVGILINIIGLVHLLGLV